MRLLQRIWSAIEEPLHFLKPLRMVAIPMALLFWGLLWSDQGQDAVRTLIEVDERLINWHANVIFCAMVTLAALQVWYWSRQLLRYDFPQYPPRVAGAGGKRDGATSHDLAMRHPRLDRWTPRILGISIYLVAAGAIGLAARDANRTAGDHTSVMALTTSVALLILAIGFGFFVVVRHRWVAEAHERVAPDETFGRVTRRILLSTVVAELLFLIWTAVTPLTAGLVFPAPSLLMISAALWVGLGSFVVYWSDRFRLPFTTAALLLAVVMSGFNDNHEVRTLTVAKGGGEVALRRPIGATFVDWYHRLMAKYPNEPQPPVFLVATEGGGIRAAYWTAAVLTAIQDQAPEFSDHLFAISGISGGSVGGTVFTALLADRQPADPARQPKPEPPPGSALRSRAQRIMSYDFLGPTLASLLHADLAQRFLPGGFVPDRAKAFETAWERAYRIQSGSDGKRDDDFLATSFLRMYSDRPTALLPSLFLNSTEVETGQRVIASNCALGDAIPDARDLLLSLGRDVRLSTAAHNSARFTYVSPAGSVVSAGGALLYHVVDGGYFEDSGAQTALDLIRIIRKYPGVPRIHLVLISFRPLLAPVASPERFVNEALSPLRALLHTRNARGDLAVAEVKGLCGTPQDLQCHPFVLTQLSRDTVIPLGWLLAPRTRANIDLQVGPQVEPATDPAIRKLVQANVDQLREIVFQVSGRRAPSRPDEAQVDADAMEQKARE